MKKLVLILMIVLINSFVAGLVYYYSKIEKLNLASIGEDYINTVIAESIYNDEDLGVSAKKLLPKYPQVSKAIVMESEKNKESFKAKVFSSSGEQNYTGYSISIFRPVGDDFLNYVGVMVEVKNNIKTEIYITKLLMLVFILDIVFLLWIAYIVHQDKLAEAKAFEYLDMLNIKDFSMIYNDKE